MAAAKRRSSARMRIFSRFDSLHVSAFSRSSSNNFPGGLGKAPRFDSPDEFQRCLGQAPAGGIEPKDGRETVATPQHDCVRAVGGGVAQQLFKLFALSDEARRVER